MNSSFARFFRSMQRNKLISGLILGVMGLMFLLSPFTSMVTMCKLVGWCILIGGIMQILSTVLGSSGTWIRNVYFYTGIVLIILGISVIRNPYRMLDWVNLVFGVIILVSGASSLLHEQQMGKYTGNHNAVLSIFSILGIVLGVVIIMNPFRTITILSRIIGIALLYEAFVDFKIFSLMKNYRDLF